MAYQAILFDLDDTLYDYRAYWQEKLHHALAEVVEQHTQLSRDALVADAVDRSMYADGLPAWLSSYGVQDAALVQRAQQRYRENWWERLDLYDDAPLLLTELREHFRLGLITNGPARTQRPKIARFGLDALMHTILVSGELGVAKPDPRIFQRALELLEVVPQQALYVGDSLVYDLVGAAAAGLDFVWMNPRGELLPSDLMRPHATIARLSELRPILGLPAR